MYFGNEYRMIDVTCPAINIDRGTGRWESSGTYLNGGAYQISSEYAHRRYSVAWNLMDADSVTQIMDYYYGIYGDGLLYMLDPFIVRRNVLPLNWSVPSLTADDAPPLVYDARPSKSDVTGGSAQRLPKEQAVYTLTAESVPVSVFIPVPPGESFTFGAVGSATGTAGVLLTPVVGSPVTPALIAVGSSLTNTTISDPGGGVHVTLTGIGTITLVALQARINAAGALPYFIAGEGNSGLRIVGAPTVSGYSSVMDKQAVSMTLVETGAWEPL